MNKSPIIWVPLGIFLVIIITFVAKYSFDRRHYKNAARRAANIENTNTTVVYTIPTTSQLNATYPEIQRQFSNGRPPTYVSSVSEKVPFFLIGPLFTDLKDS
ncbi:hypothetical protein Bhyg_07735 [Pseudolycoriella hygida]|uniref:Uncharacterized protein n=1 Tax=Pseudolycoriella hygida TaxID=35572 RepID=A0A9Q0N3J2_9DIPT|nr:hypothetical protein Bhyg_07735 [Pseudolycoriella hygida]